MALTDGPQVLVSKKGLSELKGHSAQAARKVPQKGQELWLLLLVRGREGLLPLKILLASGVRRRAQSHVALLLGFRGWNTGQ